MPFTCRLHTHFCDSTYPNMTMDFWTIKSKLSHLKKLAKQNGIITTGTKKNIVNRLWKL